jgi:hypothetical protein
LSFWAGNRVRYHQTGWLWALTRKEISDLLEIDFHVGDLYEVLQVSVAFDNGLENLFCYPRDDTLEFARVDIGALTKIEELFARETRPRTIIVNVLPLPVWPYANTVPL